MRSSGVLLGFLLVVGARADRRSDRVLHFPGVDGELPSPMYSGYLKGRAGSQTFYSHYTFTHSQRSPAADPVVLWQQGSGSSFGVGFLTEVGPMRLDRGALARNASLPRAAHNPHSWDRVSNLLTFEHPPGVGFSYCVDSSGQRTACHWNDQTQAAAFRESVDQFYSAFPDFSANRLVIFGESYAGLYVPFLLQELLRHPESVASQRLHTFAIGNGCTGTRGSSEAHRGTCNGDASPMGSPMAFCGAVEHVVSFLSAHAALPPSTVSSIQAACGFPCANATKWGTACGSFGPGCMAELERAKQIVGEFYLYNFYDTCGAGDELSVDTAEGPPVDGSGGSPYPCDTMKAAAALCNNEEARAALHMKPISFYGREWAADAFGHNDSMVYDTYSGCSYCLYPELLKHYNAVIYNGDFDTCVPWSQNAQWTSTLAEEEGYATLSPWHAWPQSRRSGQAASGYATSYRAGPTTNLTFVTVKAAGHMVPTYQPALAFDLLVRVLAGTGF